jgi:MFS family permease
MRLNIATRLHSERLHGLGRGFWRLWTAATLSSLGDGVSLVAYPWLAGTLTRNPLLIAGLPIANQLPALLLTLPAGVLIDRVDRRRLMVVTDTIRFMVTGIVAITVVTDTMSLPILYAAALILGSGQVIYENAAQTILPSLVHSERLEHANGTLWAAETVGGLFVGPPLGGLLLGIGLAAPFLFDAGSFGASAGLVWLIAGTFRARPPSDEQPEAVRSSFREDMREGIRWLWGFRLFRNLAMLLGAITFLMNVAYATFVLFAQDVLRLDARGFGLLSTATAVGAVIGSQAASAVSKRLSPARALPLAIAGLAVTYALIGLIPNPIIVAVLLVAEGFLILIWNVITVSLRQATIPSKLFGRVNSVYRLLGHGAQPLGSLAGGGLVAASTAIAGRQWGLRVPFLLTGAAMAILYLVALPRITASEIEAASAKQPG